MKSLLIIILGWLIVFVLLIQFNGKNTAPTGSPHTISRDIHLQDSFDNLDNWVLRTGSDTTSNLNMEHTKDKASIILSATNSVGIIYNSNSTLDLSKYTGGEISVYIEDVENIDYFSLYFATDSDLTGPFGYVIFEQEQLTNGWNTLPFAKSQIVPKNGFDPNSTVTVMQMLIQPVKETASIYFDALYMIHAKKGNVIFMMDDGWESQYTVGYPLLSKYDIPGNVAVIPSLVGNENYMSKRQLQRLYNEGWDFLNHTETHMDLSTLMLSDQRREIMNGMNWLNEHNFTRTSDCVAYPYGAYDDDTFTVLEEINSPFGRSIIQNIETNSPGEEFRRRVINLVPYVSIEMAKKELDVAVATGETVIFLTHKYGDSEDSMYCSEEKFEAILKYASELRDTGQIQITTVSEWLKIQH